MTPKEKAEELVKKMYAAHSNSASDITLHFAKECALVAVDEILESTKRNKYNPFDWNEITGVHYDKFWTEVKQEIQKLC
jgi:malonyl CoA-acyl carrier protein transacylase